MLAWIGWCPFFGLHFWVVLLGGTFPSYSDCTCSHAYKCIHRESMRVRARLAVLVQSSVDPARQLDNRGKTRQQGQKLSTARRIAGEHMDVNTPARPGRQGPRAYIHVSIDHPAPRSELTRRVQTHTCLGHLACPLSCSLSVA
jgi:hypothetical protein